MKVLIAGGSGLIGKHLSDSLSKDATADIFVLSRFSNIVENKHKTITYSQLNNEYRDTQFDVIINLSGASIADKHWTSAYKKELYNSRILTTRKLVEFINSRKEKPRLLVNASASGFYGNKGNEIITEDCKMGNGFIPELVQHWEREALLAHCRTVLLRTSVVISKHGGAFPKMIKTKGLGFLNWFGNGKQFFSWIHIDDVAKAVLYCIENQSISGPVNLCAPESVTSRQFVTLLAKKLKAPFSFGVPAFVIKLILGERSFLLLDSQKLKPEKLLFEKFQYSYPSLDAALNDVLQL